jgi:hypothetical protein
VNDGDRRKYGKPCGKPCFSTSTVSDDHDFHQYLMDEFAIVFADSREDGLAD